MSIDGYYTRIENKFQRLGWQEIVDNQTDYWVDICHAMPMLIDERYYFPNLESAMDFYLEGWRKRRFLNDDETPRGLDKSGIYAYGWLIHGLSIYGDPPSHGEPLPQEGQNLRQALEEIASKLHGRVPEPLGTVTF